MPLGYTKSKFTFLANLTTNFFHIKYSLSVQSLKPILSSLVDVKIKNVLDENYNLYEQKIPSIIKNLLY